MTKLLYATFGLCLAAIPALATEATPPLQPLTDLVEVQYGECSQQVGPYATQDAAWADWRAAQAQGYAVSNGVVPCWDGGSRGYCFNVFYAC